MIDQKSDHNSKNKNRKWIFHSFQLIAQLFCEFGHFWTILVGDTLEKPGVIDALNPSYIDALNPSCIDALNPSLQLIHPSVIRASLLPSITAVLCKSSFVSFQRSISATKKSVLSTYRNRFQNLFKLNLILIVITLFRWI